MHRSLLRSWFAIGLCGGLSLFVLLSLGGNQAEGQGPKSTGTKGGTPATPRETVRPRRFTGKRADAARIADFTSRHFLIHTDLPAKEAQELLKRMETMLTLISRYWGRPPVGIIECYIVKDLDIWPEGMLHPRGVQSLMERAGVTMTQVRSAGTAFQAKSTVYAVIDHGTPLHEAVHAYCGQAFGYVGPTWYSEGMAEMGHYWRESDFSVNANDIVLQYLTDQPPRPLEEIVSPDQITGDSWQNYAWRWALCHLLANNPNYAPRFRPLGLGLLLKQDVSFEQVYGNMSREIEFEYKFFLKHLVKGFRADLCGWDWKTKFRKDRQGIPVTAKIDAAHGWQPSRLTVVKGEEYEYSVSGLWGVSKTETSLTPEGNADGKGRLMGILFRDYELSEPFPLGAFGSFPAPADGDLFLRCQDDWNSLGDNKGKVTAKLKLKGKGTPLAAPKVEPPPSASASKSTPAKSAPPAKEP